MKRTLLFFVCTLLCANVLFAQYFDEGQYFQEGGLQYRVTGAGKVTVVYNFNYDYNEGVTSVNIPSSVTHTWTHEEWSDYDDDYITITDSVRTYSVTSIGGQAFYGYINLTSVTIPNSVTSIGDGAFSSCWSLTSVTIPNSVTSIGERAFEGCSSLTSVTIPNSVTSISNSAFGECSSLTSVTIPNSVTSIGNGAFRNCSSLTSVTIPNSVTSIGGAFSGCSSLTSVDIPNSVTSIGGWAFRNCSSLTSVTIHNSVTYIGDEAFAYCSSLTTINYNAINCNDFSYFNYPDYYYHQFAYCPITTINIGDSVQRIPGAFACNLDSLTSITIPNSVTSIGYGAFRDCSNLDSVTIPNSVTSIESGTFSGCSSLTSITIPNSVTSIGRSAFYNCSSLTSITIPNSVTSIGDWAFENCISLTSVTIPNSVTSIRDAAFYGCSSLTTLNYNAINCPNFYNEDYDYEYQFAYCPITTINIGDSVQRIPNYFAYSLDSLTSVTIGNSVDTIGEYAFYNCSSLTSVTIPNSVTYIGGSAFYNCSSLTSVTIGNSVTSIRGSTFYNCSSLTSVTIPNSVDTIRSSAFRNCSSLTSVTIPNSVDTIGSSAFYNCSSLTSITCLADIPPALGNNVFNNTPSNKILYVNCGLINDYISSWGYYFNSNNIQEITFDINTYVNNESGGSVAIERNNCSTATLTATANSGYSFLNWNDGNTENPRIVTLSSDTSFVANFIPATVNTDITATICQGQTYTENGFNVSEAGTYTQTLTAINGADSIVTLTLNVNPTFNTELSATICQGQVYNENGFNVSEAGVYTQTLTSVNGCDSIVTLSLNVNPTFNTELSATICQGQVYNENGFNVSEAGVYTQTLTSVNGCDSIVTLTLNVNPIFNTELSATICQGQVYTENGFNVSEAGVYTQTLTSVNGCDSIITLTLNVNPTFDTTINATINAGETYAEFGFNESEAGTYVQNLQTEFGCDSTITLVLSVNSSLIDIEETKITFYPNPTDSKITFSQKIEKVEVIDLTGKTIFTFTNAKTINIESLPAGAYYLRLTNEEKTSLQKVIKQ